MRSRANSCRRGRAAEARGTHTSRRAICAFVVAAVLLSIPVAVIAWTTWCSQNAATTADPAQPEAVDADGFPVVDWDYWLSVNPDVIAWVSVPGTSINSAIVQAPVDDPTYYLSHDIHRNENPLGCPYLDADCATAGFFSDNAVVFGHHIKHGAPMFADLASYSQEGFARQHSVILLQTPQDKRMLTVAGAAVVNGYDRTKRTSFADRDDFARWYAERLGECCVLLDSGPADGCITFVTCSYTRFSNERTLVYAT